jgi:ribosomal protein S18 acetylase RimI-like enzyme
MPAITYRSIQPSEYSFLKEMLYQALFVPEGQPKLSKSILEAPNISKYIKDWNTQKDDIAIVALYKNQLIGAIWGRNFSKQEKGYGYISDDIPEISIAILPFFRNQGIGTQLLKNIETSYRQLQIPALSLSVDKRNSAKALYLRNGFISYKEEEKSIIMVKYF